MKSKKKVDFSGEVSRMQPIILREMAKKNMMPILKSGITFPQITILDFLKGKKSCKMSDLANMLNLTMSAVTGIVDKMIRAKLVKRRRSSKDRRVVRISFLKKGHDMVRLMNRERRAAIDDLFSVFSEDEKRRYLKLVRKMYHHLIGTK